MSLRPRPARGAWSVLAALLVLLAATSVVGLADRPAHATEHVVTITPDGVDPQALQIAIGDTVRFVTTDRSFAYRAQSTGGAWRFDSGPVALLEGEYAVGSPLTAAGTYSYRVAQDAPFRGTVVVTPDGAARPGPSPSIAASAPPAAASTAPSAGPGPSVGPSAGAAAGEADGPRAAPRVLPAAPGALPAPESSRDLGLPVALALVLVAGAGSLLLRLLLAEPVGADPPASG